MVLSALLLALNAAAADVAPSAAPAKEPPKPCAELSRVPSIKFDAGNRAVVIDRSEWKILFCDDKGLAVNVVELPQFEIGQTTVDQSNGFVSAAFRPAEDARPKMLVWNSEGKKLAELDVRVLNAVIWVDDGKLKAGDPDDGVITLDYSGKVLSRTKPAPAAPKPAKAKAGAKGGATADESSRP